jgi:hypothetical protein
LRIGVSSLGRLSVRHLLTKPDPREKLGAKAQKSPGRCRGF